MSESKTLLQRRIESRDIAVEDLLTRADMLRKCRDGAYSDIRNHVTMVLDAARNAARYADLVEDLQDVERYGKNGGRG